MNKQRFFILFCIYFLQSCSSPTYYYENKDFSINFKISENTNNGTYSILINNHSDQLYVFSRDIRYYSAYDNLGNYSIGTLLLTNDFEINGQVKEDPPYRILLPKKNAKIKVSTKKTNADSLSILMVLIKYERSDSVNNKKIPESFPYIPLKIYHSWQRNSGISTPK